MLSETLNIVFLQNVNRQLITVCGSIDDGPINKEEAHQIKNQGLEVLKTIAFDLEHFESHGFDVEKIVASVNWNKKYIRTHAIVVFVKTGNSHNCRFSIVK